MIMDEDVRAKILLHLRSMSLKEYNLFSRLLNMSCYLIFPTNYLRHPPFIWQGYARSLGQQEYPLLQHFWKNCRAMADHARLHIVFLRVVRVMRVCVRVNVFACVRGAEGTKQEKNKWGGGRARCGKRFFVPFDRCFPCTFLYIG
jgi:hypothetical protein